MSQNEYKLRKMHEQDSILVLQWRNSRKVRTYMYNDHIITAKEHEKWFNAVLQNDDVDYRILEHRNIAIGQANIVKIDNTNKSCHWGLYIGSENAPPGSGTTLAELMLDIIFSEHDIETVYSEALSFNKKSIELHKKFGFILSPDKKEIVRNGINENIVMLSLTKRDYSVRKNNV